MDERFNPLLDSLLMALESLQQRLASKEDVKEGEEQLSSTLPLAFVTCKTIKQLSQIMD